MPGILFNDDWDVLQKSIDVCLESFPNETLNFVEVGLCGGMTAVDIAKVLRSKNRAFTYFGVDYNISINDKFPELTLVQGCSYEIADKIPAVHWVFIGCAGRKPLHFTEMFDL